MDVLMPQLGETVAEGKITQWFKSAGDAIKPGDNLFEIETDKVSMEVPSTTAGVLTEIRVPAGEVAPVGAVVAVIADGAAASAPPAGEALSKPAVAPASQLQSITAPVAAGEPAAAVPVKLDPFFEVRTPQRNYGPARLAGGRSVTPLARRLAAAGVTLAEGPSAEAVKALYRDVPFQEVPLDGMRTTIATRVVQAKQTIPHFYLTADVEIGRLLTLREDANAAAPKDKGGAVAYRLSVNDLVIKMWAAALQRVPAANA